MILHTVNKSPFQHACFIECLNICTPPSSILLLEDGVYAGQSNTEFSHLIDKAEELKIYALAADVQARGLHNKLHPYITLVDDSGFVELVTQHRAVQSWY